MIVGPHIWASEMFGGCDLGDPRRVKRLVGMAKSLAQHSGKSLVGVFGGSTAELEGAYRFIENKHISGEAIREGAFDSVSSKVLDYKLLLALEDTTTLSFSHAPTGTGDLGGPEGTKSRGFWVHSALLVNPDDEETVGLLDQQWWVRPERQKKDPKERDTRSYEDKESVKWQRLSESMSERLGADMSRLISVCDREADIFEYLSYKLLHGQRFIVRSSSDRSLHGQDIRLEEEADSWWPEHTRTVTVPQKGGRKKSTVQLEITASQVTLQVPKGRNSEEFEPITVNVIQAFEACSIHKDRQLFWRLYTTEPIDTKEQLDFILRGYELRWRVEDFHKSWKTGCKVEALRLRHADNIQRAASILAFVAVRLLRLREQTERHPKAPCTNLLEQSEWHCLWLSAERTKPPTQPPTIHWAHQAIVRLAGSYASKNKSRVGWLKYWQGWTRFQDLLIGWRLAHSMQDL